MAVFSRLVGSLAIILVIAVTVPILAALAFAAIGHPECATIPQDVGPCGYWASVAEFGPFIMLWGTVITVGIGATIWSIGATVFGLLRRTRRD
ncbi:hypothetical protein ACFWUP_00340 [Nocardia sp. NPDC058658]|uniref:hypothetical protein n=1 Tax=Nocardia sp. NPDC058658 TaxID=3346580 RepID=UPI00364EC5EA